ncbi:unnamed protein product [Arabis nemorensis]|uniref:Uncharacterized protein n=1 Tax=Arabis nemorensis TaxID=586526 RepID=A0A565BTD5_9BRAS|nr:unnamed protein product [Arabis nemorensis]
MWHPNVLCLNGFVYVPQFILMAVFAYLFFILPVMIQAVMSLQANAGPPVHTVKVLCSNDESPANVEAAVSSDSLHIPFCN